MGSTAFLLAIRFFRRLDRVEHNLRIGWLCQCLRHFVSMIALVWVVVTKFLQERYDLRRFLFAKNGEFQRYLLPARSHLIVVTLGHEDHCREIKGDRRDDRSQ